MKSCLPTLAAILFAVIFVPRDSQAQNPIIQTIYTADPAPMVYHDTVWLYTGHDEDGSTWFTMKDWRLFSSTDMVNWTHQGVPLSLKTFSWAASDAWAAQCIYRNGKFYWYVCAKDKQRNRMAIGVAVGDRPTGPFKDPLGKPLATVSGGDIDPTVFIDDDGQAWLYWGNPDLWYVKLNEDMTSYDQKVGVVKVPLTKESFGVRLKNEKRLTEYEEGPWLYKRKGLYYLLYPAGGVPEHLAYSTSNSPAGPWMYRDTVMSIIKKGGAFTNHPGLIDYKGNSYLFYHNGALPGGGGFTRSVCVDQIQFNADGTIPRIMRTREGVSSVAHLNPYAWVEAETIAWEQGIETNSEDGTGVYVTDINNGDYIKVRSVDFGKGAKRFQANVASAAYGGSIEIHLDSLNGSLIGTCIVKSTGGLRQWTDQSWIVKKVKEVHDVYFIFKGGEGALFNFNRWKFTAR